MTAVKCLVVLCGVLLCQSGSASGRQMEVVYKAGAYEFIPYSNLQNADETFDKNLKFVGDGAAEAKLQGVDILVFPEYGLTSVKIPDNMRELVHFSQYVKKPVWNPCEEAETGRSQVIRRLSCIAAKHKIYLVVNLIEIEGCPGSEACEEKDARLYNTEVVFDREGVLVARYRKRNLFYESPISTPELELVTFRTDFGVTFGVTICFDLMFDTPLLSLIKEEGVMDIVHSQAWLGQLPFFLSHQVLDGFAKALDVNFISSGYHNPHIGMIGSGIFKWLGSSNYTYNSSSPSLTVSEVHTRRWTNRTLVRKEAAFYDFFDPPKTQLDVTSIREWTEGIDAYHRLLKMNMSQFKWLDLSEQEKSVSLCQGRICCELSYKWRDAPQDRYRLVVHDGDNKVGQEYSWGQQVCSVVRCLSEDISSCSEHSWSHKSPDQLDEFRLRGIFDTDFVVPSVLSESLQLSSENWFWHLKRAEDTGRFRTVIYSTAPLEEPIQAITLYGKMYSLSSSACLVAVPHLVLFLLLCRL